MRLKDNLEGFARSVRQEVELIRDDISAINASLQSPPGISGISVELVSPQENDLLQLKQSKWKNIPQTTVTDGGNF